MDVDMKSATKGGSLYCNMEVFTPAEREKYVQNTARLLRGVEGVNEARDGFEFIFPSSGGKQSIELLTEFISNERLCCPFLEFTLKVPTDNGPIALLLTGPEGTREFLRAEFGEVFA